MFISNPTLNPVNKNTDSGVPKLAITQDHVVVLIDYRVICVTCQANDFRFAVLRFM